MPVHQHTHGDPDFAAALQGTLKVAAPDVTGLGGDGECTVGGEEQPHPNGGVVESGRALGVDVESGRDVIGHQAGAEPVGQHAGPTELLVGTFAEDRPTMVAAKIAGVVDRLFEDGIHTGP